MEAKETSSASSIPNALKRAREKKGWSQSQLAEAVGLSQGHISDNERDKISPRLDTVIEIARTLELESLMVHRSLVPIVGALIDQKERPSEDPTNTPLYGKHGLFANSS